MFLGDVGVVNAFRAGRRGLIQVPAPLPVRRYPSLFNCSKTVTTVPRETLCCFANSRVEGSRTPGRNLPEAIARQNS